MPVPARSPHAPSSWTEAELLSRLLAREERAWRELVRRYRPLVFRCITRVTTRHAPDLAAADLDDIHAEVLARLVKDDMRKLRMYDPARGARLSSFIGMISINAAHDFLRGLGRRPVCTDAPVPEPPEHRTPLDDVIERERWDGFRGLVGELSLRDRTFLHLYYERGLEPGAVADRMQINLKTVYTKKHKIRAHLHRSLAACPPDHPIADLERAAA
jgi:RNA polymerase sigma-70 factor (ECF subfamily)